MAKRYQPQTLLSEQDGVQTFSGRDALTGLPVLLYSFMGEPTSRPGDLTSPHIPPVLEITHVGGAGEVVTAFSPEFQPLRGTVPSQQVESLLRQTAAALDDAARAGVVHGDLSPTRVVFDGEAGGRFVLEGYGVPWRVRPTEFSPPERISGATFAGDLFSWAMTVRHLSGPLPGDLRDLLSRCLDADPQARPHAREVRAELESYAFAPHHTTPRPQAARDESAFERFATTESRVEQNQADEDDLTPPETSGWHIPLPPVITDRVSSTAQTEAHSTSTATESSPPKPPETAVTTPTVPPAAQQAKPMLEPIPRPIVQETDLPPESLRRTDGTLAYEARRKQYQAGQRVAEQSGSRPRAEKKSLEREQRSFTRSSRELETLPLEMPPLDNRGLNTQPENGEPVEAPPRTAEPVDKLILATEARPTPSNSPLPAAPRRDRVGAANATSLESVPAPEADEDFEVEDDINDRVAFGSGTRGGLRVLLSTLLVIAIVVLLALQIL